MARKGNAHGLGAAGAKELVEADLIVAQALSTQESTRLGQLETVIETGIKTFIEVGLALAEIRDARLYRLTNGSFESYCKEKWGFTRQRAYQLIGAAEVAGTLECQPRVVIPEKVLRCLAPLPVEERREVFGRAVEIAGDRPVTTSDIAAAGLTRPVRRRRRATKTTIDSTTDSIKPEVVVEAVRSSAEPTQAERRREWENGVIVGIGAALSALSEHPDFERLSEEILCHGRAELYASSRDRWADLELAAKYVRMGMAPTDHLPAPDTAATEAR